MTKLLIGMAICLAMGVIVALWVMMATIAKAEAPVTESIFYMTSVCNYTEYQQGSCV